MSWWETGIHLARVWMNSRGQVLLRGQRTVSKDANQFIRALARGTATVTANVISKCEHTLCPIIDHPVDPDVILEGCFECGVIRSYNMNIAAGSKIVHKECEPLRMCKGPEGSVFVIDEQGELLQLKWKEEKEELKLVHRICYIKM